MDEPTPERDAAVPSNGTGSEPTATEPPTLPVQAPAGPALQSTDPGNYQQAYGAPYYGAPAYPGQQYAGQPYAGQQYQGQQYQSQPYSGGQPPQATATLPVPPAEQRPRSMGRTIVAATVAGCLATVFGLAGAGVGAYAVITGPLAGATHTSQNEQASQNGLPGSGSQSLGGGTGSGGQGYGYGSQGGQSGSSGATASSAQEAGVVDIDTVLSYAGGEAAGTGMILTSNGTILTNNHVVEGSTSITVTVVSTGKEYKASVVGTDQKDDVAVIQLSGASGLTPVSTESNTVGEGDAVTAVGNAGGTGGTPSAAAGQVTGTNKSITTEAEDVIASESLTGLIETNADIQAGDSGGPLFDSSNKVVGMDTAASDGSQVPDGYAIPIATALTIAKQIEAGKASSSIVIGLPAFLGVEVGSSSEENDGSGGDDNGLGGGGNDFGGGSDLGGGSQLGTGGGEQSDAQGAVVQQIISGTPAASTGLAAGDTIVGVDGTAVSSSDGLTTALDAHKPGDSVTITWVDAQGSQQSAKVTLGSGPAA
jgi:S1-C subfamily serine protease